MSDKLVQVEHLQQYFPAGGFGKNKKYVQAVDDVSFFINRGETLGLVGESGCGKSTTGRSILRLIEPTSGEVIFDGEDVCKKNKNELRLLRRDMQLIFQDPYASLDPRKTVSEIIAEPLKLQKLITDPKARMDRVRELMQVVGLADRLINTYPHELDGGRRQRIGVARALSLDPKFIVCDEPVSALDVSIQAQVVNMFEDLQEKLGVTYLFIAHDLLIVRHISNRIAVMYLGKIVEIADADELNDYPQHPYTVSLLSAVPIPDPNITRQRKRIILEGDVPSPLRMPTGCAFRSRCRYATEKCAKECPKLEDRGNGHFVACWNK